MQETPDAIPEGETPHTVSLCLYNTMVDAVKPGDRVEVCIFLLFNSNLNSMSRLGPYVIEIFWKAFNLKLATKLVLSRPNHFELICLVQVTGVFKAMAVRVGPNQRTLRALYKVAPLPCPTLLFKLVSLEGSLLYSNP